jgi:hypothetical protein
MATRTPASVIITIRTDNGIDLLKTDGSASPTACVIENLVKSWSIGLLDQQIAGGIPGAIDALQPLVAGAQNACAPEHP